MPGSVVASAPREPPHVGPVASLRDLVGAHAARQPRAPALLAPGREPMTHEGLLRQIDATAAALRALGVGAGDRVAVVLPNGPEMAAAFLGIASTATCAPLNPAYRAQELELYLSDLRPAAIVVPRGDGSPAAAIAGRLGARVLELSALAGGPAGAFALDGGAPAGGAVPASGAGSDVALVLHTSGTTSRPKLVPLTHGNLCASAENVARSLRLEPGDRCLNVMPLFHIHGLVAALLASLAAGGSVACAPGFVAPSFLGWLDELDATWWTAVPTMHQAILLRAEAQEGTLPRGRLRLIRSSSAPLPPRVMLDLERVFRVPVVEAYGMTEGSHQIAANPLPPAPRKPGSVGVAGATEIAVLDERGCPFEPGPEGTPVGEVVIRGPAVITAYGGGAEINEGAFAGGWLRTGDQGRLDGERYLHLTGRTREIINRGGEKIAPREIDEALTEHPAVAQAVAFSLPDRRLGEGVGAAVVLRAGATATASELRRFVAARLADFKVPQRIVFVEALPRGPTGKLQRLGLAAELGLGEPEQGRPARPRTPPRTPLEETLCALWREILGAGEVSVHDDFLDLGGDSVLALRLATRLSAATGLGWTPVLLFETPTVAEQAARIASGEGFEPPAPAPVSAASLGPERPMSFAEQRMWFLAQYEESPRAYLRSLILRVRGPLDVRALEASFSEIVRRHDAVRATYHQRDGELVRVVAPHRPTPLPVVELEPVPEAERERHATGLLDAESEQPFDLTRDATLRASLLRAAADDHFLLLGMHHISSDGWSKGVLLSELGALYEAFSAGRPSPLPELLLQYPDHAAWQRDWLESGVAERQLAYWKQRLAAPLPVLALPTDRPRPPRQTFSGADLTEDLPRELSGALRAWGRREHATLFMTLMAAFQVLMTRHAGAEEIVVGVPTASRTTREAEAMLGLFMNTVALRTDLSGAPTFRELVARVRASALGAFANADVPFARVVSAVHPARGVSYSLVYQVMFQVLNLPDREPTLPGLSVEEVLLPRKRSDFDLSLEATERPDGALRLLINFNTDLFDEATARRMLGHYRALLDEVLGDADQAVGRMPLLPAPERRELLGAWNDTARALPGPCFHDLFARQAARTPDRAAASGEGVELTYRALNERANAVAARLRALGAGPEALVGVALGRSPAMLAGLLGVLKAGAAYVPLDPSYPRERLRLMIREAGLRLLLVDERTGRELGGEAPELVFLEQVGPGVAEDPASGAGGDSPAYVIFTSGSTGAPKGVVVRHRALVNVLESARRRLRMGEDDALLALATISFDIAAAELYMPLLAGGRVVIASREAASDGRRLQEELRRPGITFLQGTPSTWRLLIESGWTGPSGLTLLCTGEALPPALADELRERGAEVWNLYGPTETTIWSAVHRLADAPGPVLIGRPVDNTRLYILDAFLEPVPAGVPGELHVGGDGLARGYLGRPDLTAERFLPDPFAGPGARMYRTGDLARFLPSGEVECLGRRDGQVKVRGYRIELGEIEAALGRCEGVQGAAAVLHEDAGGDRRIVGYVAARPGRELVPAEVRQELRGTLPEFMVPAHVVVLDALPVGPSGKVDRRALQARGLEVATPEACVAPRDALEERLLRIWEQLLPVRPLGVRHDFFESGGHSLLAARLLFRIEQELGRRVRLVTLFEAPTIEQLAAALRGEGELAEPGVAALHRPETQAPRAAGALPPRARAPLFWVKADPLFVALARRLPDDRPFFGLLAPEPGEVRAPFAVEDLAAHYVRKVRQRAPGPYVLGGFCAAGVVAWEIAHQLVAAGDEVAAVILADAFNPLAVPRPELFRAARTHAARLTRLDVREGLDYVLDKTEALARTLRLSLWDAAYERRVPLGPIEGWLLGENDPAFMAFRFAAGGYRPRPHAGRVLLVRRDAAALPMLPDPSYGWGGLVERGLDVIDAPGDHIGMFREPHVGVLAQRLGDYLRALDDA